MDQKMADKWIETLVRRGHDPLVHSNGHPVTCERLCECVHCVICGSYWATNYQKGGDRRFVGKCPHD
jgi:hypothetical protein